MEHAVFYSLDGDEQVALAAILAILMSEGLNANQLNLLGNFLTGLAQNILIIQTVVSSQPSTGSPASTPDINLTLDSLQKEIAVLKAKVMALEATQ